MSRSSQPGSSQPPDRDECRCIITHSLVGGVPTVHIDPTGCTYSGHLDPDKTVFYTDATSFSQYQEPTKTE